MEGARASAHRESKGISVVLGVVAAAIVLAGSGCTATLAPEPVAFTYDEPVVRAQVVPADIYAYPRVYYGGTYVYLVNGRWYEPTARGWMVYRQEPRELRRYRTEVQRAPRVETRPPAYYPSRPPAYETRPPVYEAPREEGRERRPR
jgi:hypothetical protein